MTIPAKAALSKDALDQYPWGQDIAVLIEPTAELLKKMWALGYSDVAEGSISGTFGTVDNRAVGYALERAAWLVTGIDETTRERIRALIAETLANAGASEADLASAILAEFDGMTVGRADMIARSELAEAAGKGSAAGWKDAGIDAVLISDGDDFDEACQEADGQIWSVAKYEADPLEHPNCTRSASALAPGTYDPNEVIE